MKMECKLTRTVSFDDSGDELFVVRAAIRHYLSKMARTRPLTAGESELTAAGMRVIDALDKLD